MAVPALWATVVQVAGHAFNSAQEYAGAKSDADVAGRNASISRVNARQSMMEGLQAEEAGNRRLRQDLGEAFTASAQSGAQSWNPLDVADASRQGTLDVQNIRYGWQTERDAGLREAEQFDADQRNAKRRAKGAVVSGLLGTGAAALSGYANYKGATARGDVRKAQAKYSSRPAPAAPRRTGGTYVGPKAGF